MLVASPDGAEGPPASSTGGEVEEQTRHLRYREADGTSVRQGCRRDVCATDSFVGVPDDEGNKRDKGADGMSALQGGRRDVCATGRQTGRLRYREADGTSAVRVAP